MALDRLAPQEIQAAMDAIARIIPVLDTPDCLKIVQWATQRATQIESTVVEFRPMNDLSFNFGDEDDFFLPPMLQLVSEPPDDLPIAI